MTFFGLPSTISTIPYPGHKNRSQQREWTAQSYYDYGFDYTSFANYVLQPLGSGGNRRCRTALWDSFHDKEVSEQWYNVGDRDIAIIDGIFLLHSELASHWDYVIWLDIDNETMVNRALQRDVEWVGSTQAVEERYRQFWVPAHELYEQLTLAPSRANAFVDNQDFTKPKLSLMS